MVNDFKIYFDLNSQIVAANVLAGDGGLASVSNKQNKKLWNRQFHPETWFE